jgi:hypothetical protein
MRIATVLCRFCIWTCEQGLLNRFRQADGPSPAPFAKAKERHMKKILIAAVTLGLTANAAFAHPGEHAMTVLKTIGHLLTEPDHLAMIVVGIVVVGVLFYKRSRNTA